MDVKKLKDLNLYMVEIYHDEVILRVKDFLNLNIEDIIRKVWEMGRIEDITKYYINEKKTVYVVTTTFEKIIDFEHNRIVERGQRVVNVEAHLVNKEVWFICFPPLGKGAIASFEFDAIKYKGYDVYYSIDEKGYYVYVRFFNDL